MQTFLPVPEFNVSFSILDNQRLNAMRRESRSILTYLRLLREGDYRFENQPTVRQWYGHEDWLTLYHLAALHEWEHRGYKNNVPRPKMSYENLTPEPIWLGMESYHQSHRMVLCRKAWEHEQRGKPLGVGWDYRLMFKKFYETPEDYLHAEYVWPFSSEYKNRFPSKFLTGKFMALQTVVAPNGMEFGFKPAYAYQWRRSDKSEKLWDELLMKNREYLLSLPVDCRV